MTPSLSPGWHVSDHALKELLDDDPEDGMKLETRIMNVSGTAATYLFPVYENVRRKCQGTFFSFMLDRVRGKVMFCFHYSRLSKRRRDLTNDLSNNLYKCSTGQTATFAILINVSGKITTIFFGRSQESLICFVGGQAIRFEGWGYGGKNSAYSKQQQQSFQLDLKLFGLPSLQDKMDKAAGVVKGPIVLQVWLGKK